MGGFFTIAGRLYGRFLASGTGKGAARSVETTKRIIVREAGIARLRLRAAFLHRKHAGHLALLGKRVHRLVANGADPAAHPQVGEIIGVLGAIDAEIAAAEAELDAARATREHEGNPGA